MNQIKFFITSVVLFSIIFSQENIEGRPYSFDNEGLRTEIPTFSTIDINVNELLNEDANRSSPAPFRYGYRYQTDINATEHGSWEALDNGGVLWRLSIQSEGAYSIGLVYDNFILPEGTTLYIYNQEEDILGGYTSINNADTFSTPQIGHRTPEISELIDCLIKGIQKVLYTKNHIYLVSHAATGLWEMGTKNSVKKGVLHCSNGAFS